MLIGQVVNTNASWIAQQLNDNGIRTGYISIIPDDRAAIITALADAVKRADVVITTGGLGPTRDDITKKALSDFYGTGLVLHQPTLDHIQKLFYGRGIPVLGVNRDQALVPEGCVPLSNPFGTAPGLWFEDSGKVIISLPGVPYEMQAIVTGSVLPRLKEKDDGVYLFHRTILTHGLGESLLSERIADWEDSMPGNIKLAYLPQPGIVRLRITATGKREENLEKQVEEQVDRLKDLIPDLIFGEGNQTMEEVVGLILRDRGLTLATAESCTGGYIAHLITSVPGSSDYFRGSIIAYSNDIKEQVLGVKRSVIEKHGAVSGEVVEAMALGARHLLDADYALATSGVAGPGGGTANKPVGLVWIALATPGGVISKSFTFGDHRARNIRRSGLTALNMLRISVLGLKDPF